MSSPQPPDDMQPLTNAPAHEAMREGSPGTPSATPNAPMAMASADLDASDTAAVLEVLQSGRLALGPKVELFEKRLADYVGVPHAVAVSSGTAALHAIVRALGIGPGDEVLVPSFTFAASVNAILFEGATPVFVDIESDTFNVDVDDLEAKRSERTRAVMVVDVFGHPADWPRLQAFAERHGLLLIDDSCEALGAEIGGRRLGAWGDAAAFAFYPNKQITTGEGGMVVTRSAELAAAVRSLRNQGRPQMGAWLEHATLGYNYRMSELSGALGLSQMARLDEFLEKRAAVAMLYTKRLATPMFKDRLRPPVVRADVRMSWFVYVVTLAPAFDRDLVMRRMQQRGIPSRAYFAPVDEQPYLRQYPHRGADALPVTRRQAASTLALPFHNNLSEPEVERVVETLATVLESTGLEQVGED